jgi:hypothetical protein
MRFVVFISFLYSVVESAVILGVKTLACNYVCQEAVGVCNVATHCTVDDRCEYLYWADEDHTNVIVAGANMPDMSPLLCNQAVHKYRVAHRLPPSPPFKVRRTIQASPSGRELFPQEGRAHSMMPVWGIEEKDATVDHIIYNMNQIFQGEKLGEMMSEFPFSHPDEFETTLIRFRALIQQLNAELSALNVPSAAHRDYLNRKKQSIGSAQIFLEWERLFSVILAVFLNSPVLDANLIRIGKAIYDCDQVYRWTARAPTAVSSILMNDIFGNIPIATVPFVASREVLQAVVTVLSAEHRAAMQMGSVAPNAHPGTAWLNWYTLMGNILRMPREDQIIVSDIVCGEIVKLGLMNVVDLMDQDSSYFSIYEVGQMVKFMKTVCTRDQLSVQLRRNHFMHLLARAVGPMGPEASFMFHISSPQRTPEMVTEAIDHTRQLSLHQWSRVNNIDAEFAHSASEGDGVFVEFIHSAISEGIKPSYGLFELNDLETSVQPKAVLSDLEAMRMRNFGRLIGIALIEGQTPEVSFLNSTIFCMYNWQGNNILSMEKLAEYAAERSPEFVTNLSRLREPEVLAGSIGLDFPGTADTRSLSEDNVEEYIEAKLRYYVLEERKTSTRILLRGIYDIIPPGFFDWFSFDELVVILNGDSAPINVAQLKATTTYHNTFSESMDEQAEWFWEIVESMDQNQLGDLLQFVSGSRKTPHGGFNRGREGETWMQLKFDSSIRQDLFPKGQLCFKQFRIPKYTNKETMRLHILAALSTCDTIDIQ